MIFATATTGPRGSSSATFGTTREICGLIAEMCAMTGATSVMTAAISVATIEDKFWACPRGRAARTAAGPILSPFFRSCER